MQLVLKVSQRRAPCDLAKQPFPALQTLERFSYCLIWPILVITGTQYILPERQAGHLVLSHFCINQERSILLISLSWNTCLLRQCMDFPSSPVALFTCRMWVFKSYFIQTLVFMPTLHGFTTAIVQSSRASRCGGLFTVKCWSKCLQTQYIKETGWIKGRIYTKYLWRGNWRTKSTHNKTRHLVDLLNLWPDFATCSYKVALMPLEISLVSAGQRRE